MKKENERSAKILGFDCYYDIETKDMRAKTIFMDCLLTLAIVLHYLYSEFCFKVFYIVVSLKIELSPDENESVRDLYLETVRYSQIRESSDNSKN
jgi:hypothetical protein